MKVTNIKISGIDYPAVFSTRVLTNMEEKTGKPFEQAMTEIMQDNSVTSMFWLVDQLLQAGYKYKKAQGVDAAKPPSYDELLDIVGIDEYADLFSQATGSLSFGNIQTEAIKKEETIQGNA